MMHLDSLPVLVEIPQDKSSIDIAFLPSEQLHVDVGDVGLSRRSGCSYMQAVGVIEVFIQVQLSQNVVEFDAEMMVSKAFAILKHE